MLNKLSLVLLVIGMPCSMGVAVGQMAPGSAPALKADEPAPASPTTPAGDATKVAATVNGEPIFAFEVDGPFEAMKKAGKLGKEDPNWIKARMLAQLVDRKIANQAFLSDKSLYTQEEVAAQMKQLEEEAKKEGGTLGQLVAAQGATLERLEQDVAFRIAMQRYVQKQLQTVLPDFIREHQSEFDGTEIRAAHILLRPVGFNDNLAMIVERAKAIREEITSGKIDFATAAQKYSHAPSGEHGGDLGFIPRHGVMVEPFAAALFQLKSGEISPPVATSLGVHLIKAAEVNVGTKDIKDSMPQIQQMAAEEIVKRLINDMRARAKIEFTGAVPHFTAGTEVLATP